MWHDIALVKNVDNSEKLKWRFLNSKLNIAQSASACSELTSHQATPISQINRGRDDQLLVDENQRCGERFRRLLPDVDKLISLAGENTIHIKSQQQTYDIANSLKSIRILSIYISEMLIKFIWLSRVASESLIWARSGKVTLNKNQLNFAYL